MPEEEEGTEDKGGAVALTPDSVSEALLQLYFHLERCEQCIDGSQLYLKELGGLVSESQKARIYVTKCLDIALKSREREEEGPCLPRHLPSAGERIHTRRTRAGSFKDEHILDHLYQQNYFDFVAELKKQILRDFQCITSFARDRKYCLLYRHDGMEVVRNTLEEVLPPFLDYLTGKQQALSGRRRTIIDQVASMASYYSPTKK